MRAVNARSILVPASPSYFLLNRIVKLGIGAYGRGSTEERPLWVNPAIRSRSAERMKSVHKPTAIAMNPNRRCAPPADLLTRDQASDLDMADGSNDLTSLRDPRFAVISH